MKTQLLSEDFVRMQRLAGILNESQYHAALNEFSIPGFSDLKRKIENSKEFKNLVSAISKQLSEKDKERLKAKFPVTEAAAPMDFDDVFKKVAELNPVHDAKTLDDLTESINYSRLHEEKITKENAKEAQSKITETLRELLSLILGGVIVGAVVVAIVAFVGALIAMLMSGSMLFFIGGIVTLIVTMIIINILASQDDPYRMSSQQRPNTPDGPL